MKEIVGQIITFWCGAVTKVVKIFGKVELLKAKEWLTGRDKELPRCCFSSQMASTAQNFFQISLGPSFTHCSSKRISRNLGWKWNTLEWTGAFMECWHVMSGGLIHYAITPASEHPFHACPTMRLSGIILLSIGKLFYFVLFCFALFGGGCLILHFNMACEVYFLK